MSGLRSVALAMIAAASPIAIVAGSGCIASRRAVGGTSAGESALGGTSGVSIQHAAAQVVAAVLVRGRVCVLA